MCLCRGHGARRHLEGEAVERRGQDVFEEQEGAKQARGGEAAGRAGNMKLAPVLLGLEDTGGNLDLTLRACLRESIFQNGPEKPHRFLFEE